MWGPDTQGQGPPHERRFLIPAAQEIPRLPKPRLILLAAEISLLQVPILCCAGHPICLAVLGVNFQGPYVVGREGVPLPSRMAAPAADRICRA